MIITSKPTNIIMLRKQLFPVQMKTGKLPEWEILYKNFNIKDLKSKESSVSLCIQLLNHVQLLAAL